MNLNLLEPLGLAGLAALLPVILLYFLKLKREERVVPSTLLWKKVIEDMQVNAPFQRLKYSLLLLLQLLLLALLAFALARPYLNLTGRAGEKTILLVDTSASMSTRDAGPLKDLSRLTAAVRDAEAKVADMRSGDEFMLVAFDRDVRQLSKFTDDKVYLRSLLAGLATRDVETSAGEALDAALSLSEGHDNVRILVLSDGCFGRLNMPSAPKGPAVQGNLEDLAKSGQNLTELEKLEQRLAGVRFVSYGSDASDNVAITQIDARSRPARGTDANGNRTDALETQLFVMVENFSTQPRDVVLSLSTADARFPPKAIRLGGRPAVEESLAPDAAANATLDASRSVEVFRLPLGTSGVVTAKIDAPRDAFPADDSASVVISQTEGAKVLLVSKGHYFLEKSLATMRGVSVTKKTPEEFQALIDQGGAQATEAYDVCIFDKTAPTTWTDGGALFLGVLPPVAGYGKGAAVQEFPDVLDWDITHPVMRYVNFGNVTMLKAEAWQVPKTVRQVVEGSGGPLVIAAENDRLRVVGVAFDIFDSDWPFRTSWPLFIRNAVPWLAEASPRRHPVGQKTGTPLAIPPLAAPQPVTLVRPDGSTPEKVTLSPERSTFVRGTDSVGLYTLKDLPGGGERIYAVNLTSRTESDNRARGTLRIGDLSKQSTPSAIEARREIWRYLAAAVAVILLLEWWVFHRRVGM